MILVAVLALFCLEQVFSQPRAVVDNSTLTTQTQDLEHNGNISILNDQSTWAPFTESENGFTNAANQLPLVNPEAALLDKLLHKYNRNAKPVRLAGVPINIYIGYYLGRITKLDEINQILTTFGWLVVMWTDPYLKWDPKEEGVNEELVIDSDEIWMPEIVILNTVDRGNDLALDTNFRAKVTPYGGVQWVPGLTLATACSIDLKLFPFDTQVCFINVTNWSFRSLLNFTLLSGDIDMSLYQPHAEWKITETSAGRYNLIEGENISVIYYTIHMSRNPMLHVFNILIPSGLMSLVSMMVFPLPAESGEKMSLSISILLSYSVLMLRVADLMPTNSATVPLLTAYLTLGMGLTTLSLFMTVIILNVHHHSSHKPVPKWVQVLFFTCLGHLLCMPSVYSHRRAKRKKDKNRERFLSVRRPYESMNGCHGSTMLSSSVTKLDSENNSNNNTEAPQPLQRGCPANNVSGFEQFLNQLAERGLMVISKKEWNQALNKEGCSDQDHDTEPPVSEWHLLASVLDRLFFILYAVTAVLSLFYVVFLVLCSEDCGNE